MGQHHYNTYSSTTHSNARRIMYLALNRHGQQRKVHIPSTRSLGKLATYTKSLTQTVPHDRVEQLITRIFGTELNARNTMKQLCETGRSITETPLRGKPKCNLKKQNQNNGNKKKKAKRKCRPDDPDAENCTKPNASNSPNQKQQKQNRRKNPGPKCAEEDCKKRNLKKNLARLQPKGSTDATVTSNAGSKKTKPLKNGRNKLRTQQQQQHLLTTTTPSPTIISTTSPAPTTLLAFTTTISPGYYSSSIQPYDEEMYNDDPMASSDDFMISSSTEFHEDDDWDDTSYSPYNLLGNDQISQFIDYGNDEDEFDAK